MIPAVVKGCRITLSISLNVNQYLTSDPNRSKQVRESAQSS